MPDIFIETLEKMRNKVWELPEGEKADPLLLLCYNQLNLLAIIYQSLRGYDMRDLITDAQKGAYDYWNHTFKTQKSTLDYFSFINVLNQFGRVLTEQYGVNIPLQNRVRFFRNKVLEHWDDYAQFVNHGGGTQTGGKAAIPSISTVFEHDKRKEVIDKISAILKDFAIDFDLENLEVSNAADLPENSEKIYSILEKIDPHLTTKKKDGFVIPDGLVTLLFQFGFPVPIRDIESYSDELIGHINSTLGFAD